jgi:pimeloyl-ACP methyl ester carboxylesterase
VSSDRGNGRIPGILVLLLAAGCAASIDDVGSSESPVSGASAAHRPGWSEDDLLGVTRTVIAGDIVEYRAELQVGPGEHDRVGIHRVIRERSPWDPIAARDGVMFVHGSASTFRSATAPALVAPANFPPGFGLAPFLASQGIDVWGIDLRWTFVPLEQTDFEMMRTWNLASHVEDLRVVTEVARRVRRRTGSGDGRLFFAGHSLGGDIVYAYANAETQRPPGHRDVRGLIPIDIVYKLVSPETEFLREQAALRHQAFRAQYDAGQYAFALGAQLLPVIELGLTAPDDLSPVVPGFTNFQTATAIFAMTHLFYAPLPAYTPAYHFNAGVFDPVTGAPTGLEGVDAIDMLELALTYPPYQSMIEGVEIDALISDAVDVPYDDHLSEITVPVLHVGAAGGFGAYGAETLSLLGSSDTSSHIVQGLPAGAEAFDYGHADLLWASDAELLVWQPILEWITEH